ncbi:MAG TPA: DoxX family protein [Candidatus Acidoferrum sp.]|nr:DoxX family protein [Candidatus Acidoferrum sp.]
MRIATEGRLLDLGLLVLRCGVGLCLVMVHGWSKLGNAVAFCRGHHWEFIELVRRLGFPAPGFFAVCAALSESVGAALVTCGLYTRLAAATVTFNMLVASYAELKDGTSIESAYLYGLPFFTVLLAGPGRLSLDYLRRQLRREPAEQNAAPMSQQI